jgi:hypothetical protein
MYLVFMKKILKASIAADLIDKAFRNEGWTKKEGQCRSAMLHDFYDVKIENNKYVARRKANPAFREK